MFALAVLLSCLSREVLSSSIGTAQKQKPELDVDVHRSTKGESEHSGYIHTYMYRKQRLMRRSGKRTKTEKHNNSSGR